MRELKSRNDSFPVSASPLSKTPLQGWRGYFLALGPGILWAGAAVGVSHLVQSTRAGALYGFDLVWLIVLVLALKYPLFEYGHRYTAATGENLLRGYQRMGKWDLYLFLCLSLPGAFIGTAGVTIVTAGLAAYLLPEVGLSLPVWSFVLLGISSLLLVSGCFCWLDRLVKVIIIVLSLSTLVAVVIAVAHGERAAPGSMAPPLWMWERGGIQGFTFLLALLGWMPGPIELSVWGSLWMEERRQETGHRATMKEALFDFRVGYVGTGVLSLAFLSLGGLVIFGTGVEIPHQGVAFSCTLISLYTETIGSWAGPIIGIAAFSTMLSTVITVLDGYPRSIDRACQLAFPRYQGYSFCTYPLLVGFTALVSGGLIALFLTQAESFLLLITLGTIAAFLSSPFFGWLNYRLVTSVYMPERDRPGWIMRGVTWVAIFALAGLSLLYLLDLFLLD